MDIQNEMIKLGVYALLVRGESEDLLMGRDVNTYLKIPGLESLLEKFIIDLDKDFKFIYENDVHSFLSSIGNKLKVDLRDLEENLEKNIKEMISVGSSDIMIFYLVITKTLESLREKLFAEKLGIFIEDVYKSVYHKDPPKKLVESVSLMDESSPDILNIPNSIKNKNGMKNKSKISEKAWTALSLLYNLIFVHHLAEIYGDKVIKEQALKQIREYTKIIIKN